VVRYRKRGDELPPQTRYNMPFEILYTVAPFLVIAVLFFYTAVIQTDVDRLSKNPDVNVEVIASKWNWQFVYSDTKGPDGKPITTVGADDYIPVLVLPAGKSVQFKETSKDVIHSFWVPDILFKRDVIPGVENRFEIKLKDNAAGAYVGRCAELCGTYHSQMNFEMRVVSAGDYGRYLDALTTFGNADPDRQSKALTAIGQSPRATTTQPFETDRSARRASTTTGDTGQAAGAGD
jgi:cytochrome c oxidase subunit 2